MLEDNEPGEADEVAAESAAIEGQVWRSEAFSEQTAMTHGDSRLHTTYIRIVLAKVEYVDDVADELANLALGIDDKPGARASEVRRGRYSLSSIRCFFFQESSP
jgi:hypothetical protein